MEAIRIRQIIAEDGEVVISDLPYTKGQTVEITLSLQPTRIAPGPRLTAQQLRQSGLICVASDGIGQKPPMS